MSTMRIASADYDNAHSKVYTAAAYWILAGLVAVGILTFNKGPLVLDVHSRDFNPIVLIPVIVCIPALIYSFLAGRDWVWARSFGTSVLEADDIIAGQRLHGVLRTPFDVHATADFVMRLQCIRSKVVMVSRGHGVQDSVVVDDVLGEWTQKVPGSSDSSSAGVPFDFTLPPAMPPTAGAPGTSGAVRWALIAAAPRAGLNYHAVFPILVRGRPSHRREHAEGALDHAVAPGPAHEASAPPGSAEMSGPERTLLETRLHSAVFLRPAAWFVAALLFRAMAFPLFSMLFVVIGLVDVIVRVLQRVNTEFMLTNSRLSWSTGTFRKRRLELALQNVESISVTDSPTGRLLGYGTVIVALTGGTKERGAWVANAKELASQVQQQISRSGLTT
jgi:hypothetical protein